MPDIQAIALGQVIGGKPTDDGNFVLIQAGEATQGGAVFAIARDQLCNLIDLLALGHMQCRAIHGVPAERRDVFTTTWWEMGFDPTNNQAILSLTFGAGGRLDFALPGQIPQQMLETLRAHLEPSTTQRPGTPLN